MGLRSSVSLDEGHRSLKSIMAELRRVPVDWNEANTRLHVIDRIITECLGWPKSPQGFRVEVHQDGEFQDYVLGQPELVVWEAKRAGIYFDFPADSQKQPVQAISEIFAVSKTAAAAMRQVQGYCNDSGVEFAVVCNGHQLIAFAGIRVGHSWLKGRALSIRSLDHLDQEFALVWQCLSPDGMFEKRLLSLLTTGSTRSIPAKLSTRLMRFPVFRYKNELQANLRSLSELLLQDVVSTEALRSQFYAECYCDTGALSRDAMVSEQIIRDRYAALFSTAEDAPVLEPAAKAGAGHALTNQIMTEALARRPIVLLGDVGVGKTSFLEDLMYVRAPGEFNKAITLYIDFGSKAALEHDIRDFVIQDIDRQLLAKYKVDVRENNFVRGVYDSELRRFRGSFKGTIYRHNKTRLDEEIVLHLDGLVDNKSEHLRRSIEHIALARKRQVIIIIDNADQRSLEVQQSAFLIAHEFSSGWNSLVFIAVRPQTFYQSKRAGAFAAYPHKVFTILPPRPELVIEKRLIFALKIAEGNVSSDMLRGVRLNLSGIAAFIRVLLRSISRNRELTEILSNITGGNIRAVVEFVTRFIGSPNVEAEKIVRLQARSDDYIIPIHEFSKAAILGDYSHYVSDSSLAMNMFDVQSADRKEHFLVPLIVSYLKSSAAAKDRDGFTTTSAIVSEMQTWGFLPAQTENSLRRLTNKRLIETVARVTFEEDLLGIIGEMPDGFRVTSIGAYHIGRWLGDFAYLDAMVSDTPVFDTDTHDRMAASIESLTFLIDIIELWTLEII